jgi:6-phosphofructokinase
MLSSKLSPCTQIDKCFGFDTAVEEAQRALLAAKVEATSAYKGIGLVKLMGRQSGFIAMQASMASGKVFLLFFTVDPELMACILFCTPCLSAQQHGAH